MSRWRPATKAFLIFNVVMVGLALAVIGIAESQTEWMAGYVVIWLGTIAFIVVWPIGAIALGIAWLVAAAAVKRMGQRDRTDTFKGTPGTP